MSLPFVPSITEKQLGLIRILQRRVQCSDKLLNTYSQKLFEQDVEHLDRRQASHLIETIQGWESLPAELERLRGQLDLFHIPESGAV